VLPTAIWIRKQVVFGDESSLLPRNVPKYRQLVKDYRLRTTPAVINETVIAFKLIMLTCACRLARRGNKPGTLPGWRQFYFRDSQRERSVTKPPYRASTVSTRGTGDIWSAKPEPTQIPFDPPPSFPSDLWLKTFDILTETRKKFPYQFQMVKLCNDVVSRMTPVFRNAVTAGMTLQAAHQNMLDLLHSIVNHNLEEFEGNQCKDAVINSDQWIKLQEELVSAAKQQSATSEPPAKSEAAKPKSWLDVEISFLSDHRVEVCINGEQKHYNYGEFGFEDRRNGKQSRAWTVLYEIAGRNGTIPQAQPGKDRAMIQKRIEEIRERLRARFKIESDPIPFNGNAYQASFKINRRHCSET
jgi:hypothetical protein